MKYVVDEKFLSSYKKMFMEYAFHKPGCGMLSYRGDSIDICTCGYSSDIKNLWLMELEFVKKIEE